MNRGVLLFLGTPSTPGETALGLGLLVLAFVYVLYGIRFMRSHISSAAPKLSHLMPDGEKGYRHAFRQVSSSGRLSYSQGCWAACLRSWQAVSSRFPSGPVDALYLIFAYPLWFLAVLTFRVGLRERDQRALRAREEAAHPETVL